MQCMTFNIRESVDSLCRDGADAQYIIDESVYDNMFSVLATATFCSPITLLPSLARPG